METCPCQSRCPNGCPCPDYECSGTTTDLTTTTTVAATQTTQAKPKTSILVLSTNEGYKAPVITDSSGREEYNFFFRFSERTSVSFSCTMTFKNEVYIFGGKDGDDVRQVSKLAGCQLERIGSLAFNHAAGACANVRDEKVYLCFNTWDSGDNKKCRFSDEPNGQYIEAARSIHEHRHTRVAASHCK